MLQLLHIENIAIIERAEITFLPGFNALTGETGAGKSIVIDSLSAVLASAPPGISSGQGRIRLLSARRSVECLRSRPLLKTGWRGTKRAACYCKERFPMTAKIPAVSTGVL